MINLIVQWTGDWKLIEIDFYLSFATITEMKDNVYSIGLQEADNFDALELAMEDQFDILVIGTYNEDGTQFLWGNEVSRNHTIQKYHAQLNNKKEYDEDGNITVDEPYTELEALNVQVNKFYGWEDRQL